MQKVTLSLDSTLKEIFSYEESCAALLQAGKFLGPYEIVKINYRPFRPRRLA